MGVEAGDSVATLKATALAAADARAAAEREIGALAGALAAMPCGIDGPLVDAEGFPRDDCDVLQARTMRHRLACLHTDHKQLERNLEKALHALHAAVPRSTSAAPASAPAPLPPAASVPTDGPVTATAAADAADAVASTTTAAAAMQLDDPFGAAIAVVGDVAPGGPADEAGMKRGDRITRFGAISGSGGGGLAELASEARLNEGGAVGVRVLRTEAFGEVSLVLSVTPKQWRGRGLLGAQVLPLDSAA